MAPATFNLRRGSPSSVRGIGQALLLVAIPLFGQQRENDECQSLIDRARSSYELRRFDAAAGEFSGALSVCPQRGQLLLALGQAQLMAGQVDASIESLRRAIQLEPKNVLAHKVLGDALYLSGKEDEAEQSLNEAQALDPKFEPALYALGRIYYQQNRLPQAVKQFEQILALDAKNYRAYDNLGLCYQALDRDADALKSFLKALDLVSKDHPEYDAAFANLAEFFLRRNEYEKGFQLAAEAAQRNPRSARNYFLTGKALLGLNKGQLALRWLEKAVELDPSYREAHYLLARTYQKSGRKQDADREFDRFRQLNRTPAVRR